MRPSATLLILALLPLPSPAAVWIGQGDAMDWHDAANWAEGVAPALGETVWIRPEYHVGALLLGGGGTLDVVIDSSRNLELVLEEGTALGTVETVTGGYHRLSGAPLGGNSSWNLAARSGVKILTLADWAQVELVSGGGVLGIGPQDMDGIRHATVVARSGVVQFDDEGGPSHDGIELVLAGGDIAFSWDAGRLGSVRIEEGYTFTGGWGKVRTGHLTVEGVSDRDLRLIPGLVAPETVLRVVGTVTVGDSLETGHVIAEVAGLDLGGGERGFALVLESGRVSNGSLSGDVRVITGTLACATSGSVEVLEGFLSGEGLTVAGSLRVEGAAVDGDLSLSGNLILGGPTTWWSGQLTLEPGSRVSWVPGESGATVVDLSGGWALTGDALLSVGETDWSSAYWDSAREVRLVDAWGGASVAGAFTLVDGDKGDEGYWTLGQADDGDLLLAWTALGAAPVPEPSATAIAAAGLLVALSARRRRARPR